MAMAKKQIQSDGRSPRTRLRLPRVAIVVSRYNATITDRLLEGAVAAYEGAGGDRDDLVVVDAPGSFELPGLALLAAQQEEVAGVLAIGCIIKGETSHDEYLAHAVAYGLVSVTMKTNMPVSFGVLTVDNVAQAEERAGGRHGNKGEEAMRALLLTIRAGAELAGNRKLLASLLRVGQAVPDKAGGNG
jgi:6,7-dimethyl-8-ribityllumazine synthase